MGMMIGLALVFGAGTWSLIMTYLLTDARFGEKSPLDKLLVHQEAENEKKRRHEIRMKEMDIKLLCAPSEEALDRVFRDLEDTDALDDD